MKIGFLSHIDINLYLFRLPIMKKLIENGHEVYAIIPRGKYFNEFEKYSIKTIEYKIERKSLNLFKELKTIQNIYKKIKPLELDILHSFTIKPNIYGSIASYFTKTPVTISTITGLGSYYISDDKKSKLIKSIIEFLYKNSIKKVSGVIFQNSDDLNYFVQNNISPKEKSYLVKSSGVDTNYFNINQIDENKILSLKRELNIKDRDIVILMVARAIWHKGIKEYFESAKKVNEVKKNIKFILVGGTDDGNISCAPKSYLENSKDVLWLREREDIRELIAICDIFTLPSYREGVPRTLLEASAMSKAIITTDTVGCKEVVDNNINGFLVPIKDSKSLAEATIELIKNKNLREKFGRNAKLKAVNEFDTKIVVKKYIDIYEKLLKN